MSHGDNWARVIKGAFMAWHGYSDLDGAANRSVEPRPSSGRACPRCSRFQGMRRLACFLKFGCRGPLSASVRHVRITPKIPLSLPWVDTLWEGLNGLYEHLALWSACQCLLFTKTIISSLSCRTFPNRFFLFKIQRNNPGASENFHFAEFTVQATTSSN